MQAVHLNPSPSGTPQPLPDLAALKQLVSLDLSENLFLRVPAGLSRLQALESLTFRDNSRLTVRIGGLHGAGLSTAAMRLVRTLDTSGAMPRLYWVSMPS